jgi:hypothetical protein
MGHRETVPLDVFVHRDAPTDDAILVAMDEDAKRVWLPRSETGITYRKGSTTIAVVDVPVWLAEKKGLI